MNEEKKFFVALKGLILHGGRFLVLQRSEYARSDYLQWELPGGRMEFGEEPIEGLRREVMHKVNHL